MAAALETQTLDEANLLGTAISPGVEPQQLVLALLRTSAAEQGLFHINGVQNGIAVSRPPLFREDDTWLLCAGKVVFYVVLSPFITCYIIYDNWPSGPSLRELASAGLRQLNNIANSIELSCVWIHRNMTAPASDAIVAAVRCTLRSLHNCILQPIWRGVCVVTEGVWCYVAMPAWRGIELLADGINRFVLAPAWHGACGFSNRLGRILRVATNTTAKGLRLSLTWLHIRILVPLRTKLDMALKNVWNATTLVATALNRFILLPPWHGFCSVVKHLWRGLCIAADGVYTIARLTHRSVLRPSWRALCTVAGGMWKGACSLVTHTCRAILRMGTSSWRCACVLASGTRHQVLVPLYFWLLRYVVIPVDRYALTPAWRGVCLVGRAVKIGAYKVFLGLAAGGATGLRWVYRRGLAPIGKVVSFMANVLSSAVRRGAEHVAKATSTAAVAMASIVKKGAMTVKRAASSMSKMARAAAKEVKGVVTSAAQLVREAATPWKREQSRRTSADVAYVRDPSDWDCPHYCPHAFERPHTALTADL